MQHCYMYTGTLFNDAFGLLYYIRWSGAMYKKEDNIDGTMYC